MSNVANVMKRRNNSLPEAIEVIGFSVEHIVSIASCKQIRSSCTVSAALTIKIYVKENSMLISS